MADPTNNVGTPSVAYRAMQERWDLLRALLGGTTAMRKAGETYLPRETDEPLLTWQNRLNRSILYEALKDTIDSITSRPFSKPVSIAGELPESISMLAHDVDRTGRNLTQYSRSLFRKALTDGLAHTFVDFPETGGVQTRAEEKALRMRPTLIEYEAPDIIGWRQGDDGSLQEVRIQESRLEPVGSYGDEKVKYIRVYRPGEFELWKEAPNSEEQYKVREGPMTFKKDGRLAIPLVTLYLTRTDFMVADPPLEALAWLNVAHWQSDSDQRNILRFARAGLLFMKGLTAEDVKKRVVIGANQTFKTTSEEADAKFVEHSGKAIGAGQADLDKLEERMEVLGLQPLISRRNFGTATGQAIDEAKDQTDAEAYVRATEEALYNILVTAAAWTNEELAEDVSAEIFSDFGATVKSEVDVKILKASVSEGLISHETYLQEIKRRGILSEAVDVQTEMENAKAEHEERALGVIGAEEENADEDGSAAA